MLGVDSYTSIRNWAYATSKKSILIKIFNAKNKLLDF